jgi:hypothetical protein
MNVLFIDFDLVGEVFVQEESVTASQQIGFRYGRYLPKGSTEQV